jgi:gamma-glutamyl:cysteine ligase YbdK (ATP-grasp superfamily)
MGSEVTHRFFDAADFSEFRERLDDETALLGELMAAGKLSDRGDVGGFELEAWLVDPCGDPWPKNEQFLDKVSNPLVVPELAKFNIELNGSPSNLSGRVFSRLHDELAATWQKCLATAAELDCGIVTIGTLPSASEGLFVADNMSGMVRYQSLNDRVMALRDGQALEIEIEGDKPLSLRHRDVMLEAAATSFQIHLQCRQSTAVRDFNASLVSAAPLVAVGANSPYLFGHTLWDESRIPLFEQSVDVGDRYEPRVGLGSDYVQDSLLEIFEENRKKHLILIPMVQDSAPGNFSHLRFQNGTLWRWVRPLVGFDFDGQVHMRIEQRVASAGPTLIDCIANAAFYFGLVRGLSLDPQPIEQRLAFQDTRENFYKAARYGLNALVCWPTTNGVKEVSMRSLVVDELLPLARRGLQSLEIPDGEIDEYLGIIAGRTDNSQNGAAWQRRWMAQNEASMNDLVLHYRSLQDTDKPVHTWPL